MAPSQKTVAEEAAEKAVRDVFFLIGVDIDSVESVNAFREDLQFGRKLRLKAEESTNQFIRVVLGVILSGAMWAFAKYGHQFLGKP